MNREIQSSELVEEGTTQARHYGALVDRYATTEVDKAVETALLAELEKLRWQLQAIRKITEEINERTHDLDDPKGDIARIRALSSFD